MLCALAASRALFTSFNFHACMYTHKGHMYVDDVSNIRKQNGNVCMCNILSMRYIYMMKIYG